MATKEVINIFRFFDLEGNKRNFITEDIYDKSTDKNFLQIITDTKTEIVKIRDFVEKNSSIFIVPNITERNKLKLNKECICWVEDATDDTTVSSGGAAYLSKLNGTEITWEKITESESLDVVLSWDKIVGKPNSTVNEIDEAVNQKHNHENKAILDKISENENGNLTFGTYTLSNYTGIDKRKLFVDNQGFNSRVLSVVETLEIPDEEIF